MGSSASPSFDASVIKIEFDHERIVLLITAIAGDASTYPERRPKGPFRIQSPTLRFSAVDVVGVVELACKETNGITWGEKLSFETRTNEAILTASRFAESTQAMLIISPVLRISMIVDGGVR